MISLFRPDLEDDRLKRLSLTLMGSDSFVSAEARNYDAIWKSLFSIVKQALPAWEIEPWAGVVFLRGILEGYRAELVPWVWDRTVFSKADIALELNENIEMEMKRNGLIRLATSTPDEDLVRWLKKFDFKIEGRQKYGFKKENSLVTQYLLRKIREV